MSKKYKLITAVVVLIIAGELLARFVLGLGQTPVYIEDPDYEYIFAPNQDIERFGNHIIINKYSMRNLPLKRNEKRVLVFGDSVLNGGSLTDHSLLATTLLEKELQKTCDPSIRILNISAGSWGPDNAFAYLKKYGDFNASEIVLVFSSHDAHDNMNHEKVVDKHPSYPSSQPCCALWDGFYRYFIPRVTALFSKPDKKEFSKIHKIDHSKIFNTGWQDFADYAKRNNLKLFVVLHPTQTEISSGKYDENGVEIINFLKQNHIPYILELNRTKKAFFRDDIHYNPKGQQFLFEELMPVLEEDVCSNTV